jgi:MFS family permease
MRGLRLSPSSKWVSVFISRALAGYPTAYLYAWGVVLLNRSGAWVFPFLMLFLTTERGLSVQAAGLVMSCFGAGAVCAAALGGKLADRWGRKPTIVLSMFGGACATAALWFAQLPAALFACAFALGAIGELYRPAVSASVSDVVAPEDQRAAFAHLYWAHNFGFAVAPAAAGLVVASYGFVPLFSVNMLALLACGALALWRLPETKPVLARTPAAVPARLLSLGVFRDARLALFLAAFAPMPLIMLQTVTVLPMLLREDGLDAAAYGRIISINGALIVLLQPWIVARLSQLPRAPVLMAGAVCLALGYAGHAFARSPLEHVLTLVIWTLGEIALVPLSAAVVAELAPAAERGRYQGAYTLTWSTAQLASPWIATHVLSGLGATGWGIAVACAGMLAASLYAAFFARAALRP